MIKIMSIALSALLSVGILPVREIDTRIGCAVADDPMGPFVKYEDNPIMHDDFPRVSGPGHNSVAWTPDGKEMFIVYHIHTASDEGGFNRQVCIDRMGWDENGKLWCDGPTTTPQPAPSGTF